MLNFFRKMIDRWAVYLGFREGTPEKTGQPLWTPRFEGDELNQAQLDALLGIAELDSSMRFDNASHFNCPEANAIAAMLRAFYDEAHAQSFIHEHMEHDDCGPADHTLLRAI